MTLLVTGGNGFVMSNLVRTWLERHATDRVIVLDRAKPDPPAKRFFNAVGARLDWIEADISDGPSWFAALRDAGITHIVHGATITPHPFVDDDGVERFPEREDPAAVMRVNLMGTVAVLELARWLDTLRRVVYVSSGAVYGDVGPAAGGPLPEEGYVDPHELYSVSKYASELTVRRYAALFGLPAVAVRLSSVYGPMDRVTTARHVECLPKRIVTQALDGKILRPWGMDGIGDYISATDAAEAIGRLLAAAAPRHAVYNVAYGRTATLRALLDIIREKIPFEMEEAACAQDAGVTCDPSRRHGRWGAYDISRLEDEFGWRPAPLHQRLHEYADWVRTERAAGDPDDTQA